MQRTRGRTGKERIPQGSATAAAVVVQRPVVWVIGTPCRGAISVWSQTRTVGACRRAGAVAAWISTRRPLIEKEWWCRLGRASPSRAAADSRAVAS